MSPPDSTAPLSSTLRSSSMKPLDMPLPLLNEARTYELSLSDKGKHQRGWLSIASYSWKRRSVRIRGPPPASIFCHQIDPGRASKQHSVRSKVGMPARDHMEIPPDRIRPDS